MKKHVLCTSAIALGVAAAPAMAQEWTMNVGGHFQGHAVYAQSGGPGNDLAVNNVDVDGFNFMTDAEIDFNPSITLDNGLTFSALVELEGQEVGGGQIDHTFMTISGDSFGTLQFGNLNSVTYNNSWTTPGVGSIGVDSGTMSNFIPLITGQTVGSVGSFLTAHPDFSGDSMKINYITPSFSGFTLGVSYTPEVAGNSINTGPIDQNNPAGMLDVFGLSADYSQSMGGADVTLHAHYQQGDAGAGVDPSNWGVGAMVGFSQFAVGFSYAEVDRDTGGAADKSEHLSVGATYDAGAWTFGMDVAWQNDNAAGLTGGDVEQVAYRLGAAREIGPGVTWDVFAIYYDGDDKSVLPAGVSNDVDGTLIGTALTLSF